MGTTPSQPQPPSITAPVLDNAFNASVEPNPPVAAADKSSNVSLASANFTFSVGAMTFAVTDQSIANVPENSQETDTRAAIKENVIASQLSHVLVNLAPGTFCAFPYRDDLNVIPIDSTIGGILVPTNMIQIGKDGTAVALQDIPVQIANARIFSNDPNDSHVTNFTGEDITCPATVKKGTKLNYIPQLAA